MQIPVQTNIGMKMSVYKTNQMLEVQFEAFNATIEMKWGE